jgi:hypothetical protein
MPLLASCARRAFFMSVFRKSHKNFLFPLAKGRII